MRRDADALHVVAVGQTPPPYGGQAIMIEKMLRGTYERLVFHGVRMAFSRDMDEVGKPSLGKLLHLPVLIARIAWARWRTGSRVLYYPPAGPDRVPFYRDVAILLATRWMFERTVFHFHAGGISELRERLSPLGRLFYRLAYDEADLAIRLSPLSPPDDTVLRARRSVVVPYGLPDEASIYPAEPDEVPRCDSGGETPRILFVAVLRESKGLDVLIDAADELVRRGVDFRLDCLGRFESPAYQRRVRQRLKGGLGERIHFAGVRTGATKWEAYARADLLCLPSFFESEALPLVVIEAMQFGLPVVATRWRGIPFMVEPGRTGALVPVRDSMALADALEPLLCDAKLREEMGRMGRKRYLEKFTMDRWFAELEAAIVDACAEPGSAPEDER